MTIDFARLAKTIMEVAANKKGQDIICLDLRKVSLVADYFVLVSGRTERQVQAIVQGIKEDLAESEITPGHIEGQRDGRWVLMDFGGIIVHVFHQEAREYYQLERLWADAPQQEFMQSRTS